MSLQQMRIVFEEVWFQIFIWMILQACWWKTDLSEGLFFQAFVGGAGEKAVGELLEG